MTFPVITGSFTGKVTAAVDITPPTYVSSEVGNVSNQTLVITFSEAITSPGADYITGFTLRINGSIETILTGVKAGSKITHTFSEIVDASDTVTIQYDTPPGDIEDPSSNALASFTQQTATNNTAPVAGFLFNNKANSHWIPFW